VRSDIYSVGAIWYFLLTGKAPSGSDMRSVLLKSQNITVLQADTIMKCLAQNISDRYLNCDELIQRLNPPVAVSNDTSKSMSNHYISEVTREYIVESLKDFYYEQMNRYVINVRTEDSDYGAIFWYNGRKNEPEFLNRLYNLSEIPSHDSRVRSFEEEIYLHTVTNDDYELYWIFNEERLSLKSGDDETLLRFLCEMFHPAIRKKRSDWEIVLDKINGLINADGYEIYESSKISNQSVYSYRSKI
jgi:serine/threonine protein kinase